MSKCTVDTIVKQTNKKNYFFLSKGYFRQKVAQFSPLSLAICNAIWFGLYS